MGGRFSLPGKSRADSVEVSGNKSSTVNSEDRIRGTIYGNCIGDAIGLLTEFMTKDEAKENYGEKRKAGLQYEDKEVDLHRLRWKNGDWTDDSDQMILIMQMLVDNNGKVDHVDFARRLLFWRDHGNPDHGDHVGLGIGTTTHKVMTHPEYATNPHKASEEAWEGTGRYVAPNGGVMRTSVLGTHHYDNVDTVISNTLDVCKTTHYDHRCQASCVAVTTAIALMLQAKPEHLSRNGGRFNISAIIDAAFSHAVKCLPEGNKEMVNELRELIYVKSKKLSLLNLDEDGKIGYTYKCLGSGFWALRQNKFKEALTELIMEAGDADTNGAVAGALLGCKFGASNLPADWLNGLKHKDWLDELIDRYLEMSLSRFKQDEATQNTANVQEVIVSTESHPQNDERDVSDGSHQQSAESKDCKDLQQTTPISEDTQQQSSEMNNSEDVHDQQATPQSG